jgi:outer membrane receptor protein involved in Fe transport
MSKIVKFALVAFAVLSLSAIAMAQSTTTGAIGGVVTNPNKEVVPGAAVTVKNTGTNKEDTGTTDDSGRFKIGNLQPGNYSVTVNASGFSPLTQEKVVVEIGRETTLDAALSIGAVTGQVEVTSEAPVINTTQQDFSTNINQTSINELPINGRRWSNFALLTPGSALDGTFGLISFRGISGLLNNNTIDGGDNNQAFFSEERGRTRISYVISQAAVREFQVNTSNYSAEYGRAAGGVVNAITKSGTNQFHGSGFYYQRNNKWGARNPLATRTVQTGPGTFDVVGIKPVDVRHQFGGTIGGPIKKDKLFFFFSYDEQRRNFPGLSIFTATDFLNRADTCLLTAPNNSAVTLTQCPAFSGTANPSRAGTLGTGKGLTTAQVNDALSFLNSISGEVPRRGDQRLFLPKIDWIINDKNSASFSYNRLRWDSPAGIQTQATNTRAKDNFGDDFVNVDSFNARLQSTFTPTMVNEFRFQYGKDNEFEFSQPPLPGEPTTSVGGRSPQTFITNGFSFGIPEFLERVAFPNETRYQFADTVTMTAGNHTIKFGGDLNRVHEQINNLRFSGGEFNYNGGTNAVGYYGGLNDFIVDYENFKAGGNTTGLCYSSTRNRGKCYSGNFNQGFGVLGLTFNTWDVNYFVQDDIRVSPRLTVNLGLRYEYQKNPDPVNVNPLLPQTANMPNDKNNFGPRVGFAYDLKGDGKTSIRGGYGIYYGRIINSTIYNALINTGVGITQGQRQVTVTATSGIAPSYPNLIGSGALTTPAVQYFASNFANPQIYQYDLILEREIAHNTVASVSYVGSAGRRLPTFVDQNLNPPSVMKPFSVLNGPLAGQTFTIPVFDTTRPNPNFAQITEIRSSVKSDYNAFIAQVNRRFTKGLQFQGSYTFSRATDTGQASVTFTSNNIPFNVFDLSSESGKSNFDSPHKVSISAVWAPNPFGPDDSKAARVIFNNWTLAPVFYAFSGSPYSAGVSVSGTPSGLAPGLGGLNLSGGTTRMPILPRNSFRRPRIVNFDMRLSRRIKFTESTNLEFLAEAFNVFNRTQVTNVNSTMYSLAFGGTQTALGTFSFNTPFQSISETGATLFRERQVQLAVRFEF